MMNEEEAKALHEYISALKLALDELEQAVITGDGERLAQMLEMLRDSMVDNAHGLSIDDSINLLIDGLREGSIAREDADEEPE